MNLSAKYSEDMLIPEIQKRSNEGHCTRKSVFIPKVIKNWGAGFGKNQILNHFRYTRFSIKSLLSITWILQENLESISIQSL